MLKKEYEKPAMEVVRLQPKGVLMTSDLVEATMDGTWEEVTI